MTEKPASSKLEAQEPTATERAVIMPIGPNTQASRYPPCPEHEPPEMSRWRLLERNLTHRNLDSFRDTAETQIRGLPDGHPMLRELLQETAQLGTMPRPAQIADLMNTCQRAEPGLAQRIMNLSQQDIAARNADFNARREYDKAQRHREHQQAETVISRADPWRWAGLCLMLAVTIGVYIGLTWLRRAYLSDLPVIDVLASIGIILILAYPAYRAGRMFSDLRNGGPFQPKCHCPWAGTRPASKGAIRHALARLCRNGRQ